MSEIRDFIFNEPLFDTHEHQTGYSQNWPKPYFRNFLGYAIDGLATVGVPELLEYDISGKAAAGIPIPPEAEQKLFKAWTFLRTSGYGQAVELGIKTLFDLDFTAAQSEAINAAMQDFLQGRSGEEIYNNLYELVNIKWVINDSIGEAITPLTVYTGDNFPAFFKFTLRDGRLRVFTITNQTQIKDLEKAMDWSIHSLADLDRLMDEHTEQAMATHNLVAFKIGSAYSRPLDYAEEVTFSAADKIFTALLKGKQVAAKPLHDYLAHQVFKWAEIHDIPVQIHTGALGGNWGDIRNGDPAPLIPIFQKYRKVKFDLFHASWPFCEFVGAVAKAFPNVWVDLCWAWAVNPVQMERILNEWLSALPNHKILGFGADTFNPFAMVGYAQQARNGIANVLERKINTGEYNLDTAKFVAQRIMHQNARELFRPS